MKKFFIITLSFLLLSSALYSQSSSAKNLPSPYEPEILKSFADSLYEEGFLTQAEGEYKRYLFSNQSQDKDDISFQSSLITLTDIYKRQNNTNGILWLRQNFYESAGIPVKEKINFTQAAFIFKTRNADDFLTFADSFEQDKANFSSTFLDLLDTSTLVLNKDIDALKNQCARLSAVNPDYEKLNTLCLDYKRKSPGLALFLSTIIPGSGKWYTGSFGAFVSSFLSIGSFVAGTVVSGIQTEWKSWQPYVFGTGALVLYIAEIYGAYQSAKRYNTAQFRSLCEETDKIYEKEY